MSSSVLSSQRITQSLGTSSALAVSPVLGSNTASYSHVRLPRRRWLARYLRAPDAADRDRASPSAGRTAHATIGGADGAGDRAGRAPGHVRRSPYPVRRTPIAPTHAALRFR